MEFLDCPAGILCLDLEEFPTDLFQLGIISGIDLGVGAIYVQGIGVEGQLL